MSTETEVMQKVAYPLIQLRMTEVILQFPDNSLLNRFIKTTEDNGHMTRVRQRKLKARLTSEQLILALELYGAVLKGKSRFFH